MPLFINHLTRRAFLRNTAIAGTTTAFSARSWSQVAGANADIRVAVVGLNGRGGSHLSSLRRISGVRLVALCDVDTAVLLHRPSDRRCPAFRRGHIEMESVVFEDVTRNDVCPFSGEELCLGETLPTGSPRDDDNFPLKPTSHDSPSFPEAPDASSQRCLPEASPDRAPRTPQRL